MKTQFFLNELPENIKNMIKKDPKIAELLNSFNSQSIVIDFANDQNILQQIYQHLEKTQQPQSQQPQQPRQEQPKPKAPNLDTLFKVLSPIFAEVLKPQANDKTQPEPEARETERPATSVNSGAQEDKFTHVSTANNGQRSNTISLNEATILADKGYMITEDQKGEGVCILVPIIKGSKIHTQSGEGEIAILIESPIVSHNELLTSLVDIRLNYINRISISEDILQKVDFSRAVGEKSDDLFVYYVPYIQERKIDRQIF